MQVSLRTNRVGLFTTLLGVGTAYVILAAVPFASAAPTADQKKELAAIKTDLQKVGGLIGKKKLDEAKAELDEAAKRIDKLNADGVTAETEPAMKGLGKLLESQRAIWAKKAGVSTVSFANDVAPILSAKCLNCHDETCRGNLRMDTFAWMKRGGANGALAVAGHANNSQLVQRITTPRSDFRMPKGGEPLKPAEVEKIVAWINEGAKFDGSAEDTPLVSLKMKRPDEPPPVIVQATGNEKVSFVKDIAPTFVNVCGGCHGGNNPRSGFSLESFETLMVGGDSGKVIVPGKPDESRLWRLVNADDTPVMPQGQGRITRKWHGDLRTWIEEGAKFDSPDAKRPLRQLIPSEEELAQAALAKLTPEQWAERRRSTAITNWEQTLPKVEPKIIDTAEFVLLGDVPEPRLREVEQIASASLLELKDLFGDQTSPAWKGKLSITVFQDRYGYEEYNQSVQRREVPREVAGHFVVDARGENSLVVIQDIGDDVSDSAAGLKGLLMEQLTGAFLSRDGGNLPDWLLQGTGMALAVRDSDGALAAYVAGLRKQARTILGAAKFKPEDLLKNGTLSPAQRGPIGFTLVDFLMRQRGGSKQLRALVGRLKGGDNLDTAVAGVYGVDARAIALAYAESTGVSPVAPGKNSQGKKKK